MINRIHDVDLVRETVRDLTNGKNTTDIDQWMADDRNIAFLNDRGDIALFEYRAPGICDAHYNFVSRGRSAIDAGKEFLAEIFKECYNIQVVRGFTPIKRVAARWMNRQLGVKASGVVTINDEKFELFILTKKEFLNE